MCQNNILHSSGSESRRVDVARERYLDDLFSRDFSQTFHVSGSCGASLEAGWSSHVCCESTWPHEHLLVRTSTLRLVEFSGVESTTTVEPQGFGMCTITSSPRNDLNEAEANLFTIRGVR